VGVSSSRCGEGDKLRRGRRHCRVGSLRENIVEILIKGGSVERDLGRSFYSTGSPEADLKDSVSNRQFQDINTVSFKLVRLNSRTPAKNES